MAAAQSRKAIRQGVRLLLLNRTSAADRVFCNRTEAIQHNRAGGELPVLLVMTPVEPAELACQAPPVYRRRLRVAVEVIVQRDEGFSVDLDGVGEPLGESETEEVDRICHDVEQLLLADPRLFFTTGFNAADDCEYVDTPFEFEDKGEAALGAARVQFDYIYQTEILERGVAAAVDLTHVHVDHAPFPPDERVEMVTEVDIPVT